MKLGVISDIHGNLPALEAVLAELDSRGVTEFVCVGDIIGVLGFPNEVANLIKQDARDAILGNHDLRVSPDREWTPVHDFEVVEYEQTLDELDTETHEWLVNLPRVQTTDDGILLAHARPDSNDPSGVESGSSGVHPRDFISLGAEVDASVVLLGHTHYQHAVNLDRFDGQSGVVLNPGSVGFPWNYQVMETDVGESTYTGKASFAILDTVTLDYELCSVQYNSEAVVSHLRENGLSTVEGPGNETAERNQNRGSF